MGLKAKRSTARVEACQPLSATFGETCRRLADEPAAAKARCPAEAS